jgi:hypothetical protein
LFCHFLKEEAMILSANRFGILIVSSALTMGLLTPFAAAQMGRGMRSGSMGMSSSMGPNTFMGGIGMGANRNMMMGMGRNSASPSGMPSGRQAGNSAMNSGGGNGSASQSAHASYGPYQSNDGYASMYTSQGAGSSQQTAGRNELTYLRQFAGGLAWPMALRYLTREDYWKELREGIDAQVEELLSRQDGQPVPANLLEGLKGNVDKLRKRLDRESYDMPTTSRQEADARSFLGKLRSAVGQFPVLASAATGTK